MPFKGSFYNNCFLFCHYIHSGFSYNIPIGEEDSSQLKKTTFYDKRIPLNLDPLFAVMMLSPLKIFSDIIWLVELG